MRVREYQVRVRVHSSLTRTFTSFYSDFRAFFNCEVDSLTRTTRILDGRSQVNTHSRTFLLELIQSGNIIIMSSVYYDISCISLIAVVLIDQVREL